MPEPAPPPPYAQTIVELYAELQARGFTLPDLVRVRDAYALATGLFTTRQQSSGKCFMAHLVGTASILARMDAPVDVVAAGLLHNTYRTGDFGDGGRGPSAARRAAVRRAVGDEVEGHVARFATLPWRDAFAGYEQSLATLDPLDVAVLRIRVADLLEHLLDLGPVYGDAQEAGFVRRAPAVASLAGALGHPEIADEITRALTAILAFPSPPGDRGGHSRSYPPRSFRRRRLLRWRRMLRAGTALP